MCHSTLHAHCAIFIPPCFRQWLKRLWCNPALWKGFCCSTPQLSAPSHINLFLIAGRRSGRQSCALSAAATAFSGFCFEWCLLWIGMSCLGRSSRSLWARRKIIQARRYRGLFPARPCFVLLASCALNITDWPNSSAVAGRVNFTSSPSSFSYISPFQIYANCLKQKLITLSDKFIRKTWI